MYRFISKLCKYSSMKTAQAARSEHNKTDIRQKKLASIKLQRHLLSGMRTDVMRVC